MAGAYEETGSSKQSVKSSCEDPFIHDEELLESYTKIWESFTHDRENNCSSPDQLFVH